MCLNLFFKQALNPILPSKLSLSSTQYQTNQTQISVLNGWGPCWFLCDPDQIALSRLYGWCWCGTIVVVDMTGGYHITLKSIKRPLWLLLVWHHRSFRHERGGYYTQMYVRTETSAISRRLPTPLAHTSAPRNP